MTNEQKLIEMIRNSTDPKEALTTALEAVHAALARLESEPEGPLEIPSAKA